MREDAPMSLSHPIAGPLHPARFIQRRNRFLVTVRLEVTSEEVEAHLPDPGRLRELLLPGSRMWLSVASNPARRTRWTAVLVESASGKELVSLDTTLPNRLIARALHLGALEELRGWSMVKGEVPVGRSRLDFLLSGPDGRRLFLEVKSVTLVERGVALFPDAVTERGARHVRELAEATLQEDTEAAILFVLQRSDAQEIRAARRIDPRFSDALEQARAAGVRLLGRRCRVHLREVVLGPPVPVGVG